MKKRLKNIIAKYPRFYIFLALCLLGAIGLTIFLQFNELAFPLAGISFVVNRDQAEKVAEKYLGGMGYNTAGYESSVIFGYDNDAKEFLEKKLPQDEAVKMMNGKIPVWRWQVRFFKYFKQEEYSVYVEPTGKITGFERTVSDDMKSEDPGREQGKLKALAFLGAHGVETRKLDLIDQGGKPLSGRTDRYYTFKERGFDIFGAHLYYNVKYQGQRPGSYKTYLHIPEKEKLLWAAEGKKGDLLVLIANLLVILLLIGTIIYLQKTRVGFRWKFAAVAAGLLGVVTLLEQINTIALAKSGYVTNLDKGSFWTGIWLGILIAVVLYTVVAFFSASLGISMAQNTPGKERPLLVLGGRRIPANIFVGYLTAFIVMGYDVVFYLGGKKLLGVWTPLDIPYDNILSTPLPWVNALFVGFSAAVLEELIFRMCSITFLKKWTGNTALALVIPAVLWAMLHCNYPQEPFYIRAVELTFVGIFLGWIYMRFGILATIVSHYCLNATYGSALLIKSGNPYLVMSGFITIGLMLIPAIVAIAAGKKLRNYEAKALREIEEEKFQQSLIPASENVSFSGITSSSSSEGIAVTREVPVLSFSKVKKIALGAIAFVSILLILFLKPPVLGGDIKFSVDQFKAAQIAREFLQSKGVNLTGASLGIFSQEYPSPQETRYLCRELGFKQAGKHIAKYMPRVLWVADVNYSGKKESYRVFIYPDGRVFTWFHRIADEAGNAKLPNAKARELASAYLKEFTGEFEYSDFQQKGFPSRNDYDFIYKESTGDISKAKLMASVKVQGNEALGFRKYFELPDSFKRKWTEENFRETLSQAFLIIFAGALFIWSLVYSLKRKMQGEMDIKYGLTIAVVVAAATLAGKINNFGEIWTDMAFSEVFSRAVIMWALQSVLMAFTLGMLSFYMFSIIESLFRELHPECPYLKPWTSWELKAGWKSPNVRWGFVLALGLTLVTSIPLYAMIPDDKILTWFRDYSLWRQMPSGVPLLPFADYICKAFSGGIVSVGVILFVFLSLRKILRKEIFVIPAVVALVVVYTLSQVQPSGMSVVPAAILINLVRTALIWLFVRYFIRTNLAAYLWLPVLLAIPAGAMILIKAGTVFYLINGIALLLAVPVLPMIFPLAGRLLNRRKVEKAVADEPPRFDLPDNTEDVTPEPPAAGSEDIGLLQKNQD
ncbi:MAG: CPBP family intramembrane metalloprotease [Firmicutes bacterium]|nr:CPBP family intramembrane metalloprotease [Bacillota bacterium]